MPGSANAGSEMTSAKLGIPAWTAVTPLASWTNTGGGQATFQYRVWPLINEVEVIATLAPGTLTDATVIGSLAGVAPASIQNQPVQVQGNAAAPVQTPTLTLLANGNLEIFHIPAAITEMAFHLWYSLDA